MGIRYLAISIAADDVERAQNDPCPFCSASYIRNRQPDRRWDDYLDLDKAFHDLSTVLSDDDGVPQPGHALVAGSVTNGPDGWTPHEAALTAETVRTVAAAISQLTEDDVRLKLAGRYRYGRDGDDAEQLGYVLEYLQRAKDYLAVVVSEGRGLAYMIG